MARRPAPGVPACARPCNTPRTRNAGRDGTRHSARRTPGSRRRHGARRAVDHGPRSSRGRATAPRDSPRHDHPRSRQSRPHARRRRRAPQAGTGDRRSARDVSGAESGALPPGRGRDRGLGRGAHPSDRRRNRRIEGACRPRCHRPRPSARRRDHRIPARNDDRRRSGPDHRVHCGTHHRKRHRYPARRRSRSAGDASGRQVDRPRRRERSEATRNTPRQAGPDRCRAAPGVCRDTRGGPRTGDDRRATLAERRLRVVSPRCHGPRHSGRRKFRRRPAGDARGRWRRAGTSRQGEGPCSGRASSARSPGRTEPAGGRGRAAVQRFGVGRLVAGTFDVYRSIAQTMEGQ